MPDRVPEPPRRPVARLEDDAGETAQQDADEKKPKKKKKKKKKKKPKKKDAKTSGSEGDPAKAAKARKEAARKRVAGRGLLKVLGAKREGGDGALSDVFNDGEGEGSLGSAFSGIKGVDIATEDGESGTRGGGNGEAVGVGDLETKGGGRVRTGQKRETAVRGELAEQTPEVDGSLDPAAVRRAMRRRLSAIKSCYERALKRNRNLKGKLIISFEINARGRVRNVSFGGSVGSRKMESCIRRIARRWVLPRPDDPPVFVDFPVVLTPSG
jgi:outer membrane biosynthesis protein TonB